MINLLKKNGYLCCVMKLSVIQTIFPPTQISKARKKNKFFYYIIFLLPKINKWKLP